GTVSGSHTYGDNGTYTVTVIVCDDNSGCSSDTLTVTVSNVAPTVNAGADQSTSEGTSISLAPATFSDPGYDYAPGLTQENFTATINWGDGTTVSGLVSETPGAAGTP